jgi:hypothetical protein
VDLKSYIEEEELNGENRLRWAKIHDDDVCGWISGFEMMGKLLEVGCRRENLYVPSHFLHICIILALTL